MFLKCNNYVFMLKFLYVILMKISGFDIVKYVKMTSNNTYVL
jgi:hypothetical protein